MQVITQKGRAAHDRFVPKEFWYASSSVD